MITLTDLKVLFVIFYDNNPSGYNQAFANAGYSIPSDSVSAKNFVIGQMYSLYLNNPDKLKAIMDNVSWDYNNRNYTNNGDVRGKLFEYFKRNTTTPNAVGKIDWGNIETLLFGNHTTIVSQANSNPSSPTKSIWGILGYLGIGVLALILVIVLVRTLRK